MSPTRPTTARTRAPNSTDGSAGSRRERILNSAIAAFAARGFDGATWKIIADGAGVTQGLIRFYFQDKENLWREAVRRARDNRIAHMPPSAVRGGKVSRAGVERWLRAYANHVAQHPDEARILMQESHDVSPRLQWAADTFMAQDARDFIDAVNVLKNHGWFSGIDAHSLRYMMAGAAQYFFLVPAEWKAISGYHVHNARGVERHVDAVVALFMAHAPADDA